uniref:Fic family protein n=1 Tax=Methylobacterium oryzae TaxID=334852 RepID=UPI00155DDBE0|nr:Fic family protein [Methylobacterium oryzae]
MTTQPLAWQAHLAPNYDQLMKIACDACFQNIINDKNYRNSIINDPRILHKQLFSQFAPASHPEYAGTYRGSPGTTLEHRIARARQLLDPNQTFVFSAPSQVEKDTNNLIVIINSQIQPALGASNYAKLLLLAHAFCWFGTIHPFLDGNGHVQRALFAALALEMNIPLSNRFAIHPRVYDSLLAYPLEMFTRTSGNDTWKAMVAEYISNWLAGSFDAPGTGVP